MDEQGKTEMVFNLTVSYEDFWKKLPEFLAELEKAYASDKHTLKVNINVQD